MTSIQRCNERLSQFSKARKLNKRHRDLKGRNKTLCENIIIIFIECSKEYFEKLLKLISEYSKIV